MDELYERFDEKMSYFNREGRRIPLIYDKAGQPITWKKYHELKAELDYVVIGQDIVGDLWVSTVWLGYNNALFAERPVIFETMVFLADGGQPDTSYDFETTRYHTEEEARKGHEDMVTLVRATQTSVEDGIEP